MKNVKFIKIDINAETLSIPTGYDLVVTEGGKPETAAVLYGFNEIGLLDDEYKNPVYGYLKFEI